MPKKTRPPQPKLVTPRPPPGILELDRFSETSLTKWNEHSRDLDQLADELFHSLRPEQNRLRDAILGALESVGGKQLELQNWCRVVSYKYSLQPLACLGSMLTIGGRFNPGAELNPGTMAPFPALYVGQDFETAFREKFQIAPTATVDGLTPQELSLDPGASHTTVQLRGQLLRLFEVTVKNLDPVATVLRKIKMPPRAQALKKKLGTGEPRMITNGQQLHRSVLDFNWRQGPVQFGLPAQSQVLAEFIRAAGYEGVLYKSTKGPGSCVAVFPDKLLDGSFIELAGAAPQEVKHLRLDGVSAIDLCGYDGLPSQAKRLVQGG